MSSGRLRQRITIQERVSSTDSRGFQHVSWQDICTVWAAAENLRGREFFAAAAVQAEHTVKFTIRGGVACLGESSYWKQKRTKNLHFDAIFCSTC